MSRPIRILHLADSHIGAGLPSRPKRSRRRRGDDLVDSYRRVLARAFEYDVDLVIHAGDVFDKPAPGDGLITAAAEPLLRIAGAGIPVVVVPGNHERSCIPASLLLAHERIHIAGGPGTFRFRLRGCRVSIAAVPCMRRGAAERFAGAVARTGWADACSDINLLAVHQTFESAVCGPGSFRFRSGDDVIERDAVPSEFAYVAAGHIHRHQVLDSPHDDGPPIVYTGSCDRVSFAEIDEPKGCVLIEIGSDGGLEHRFIEHAVRPMVAVPLDLSGLDRRQIFERIMERVAALPPNAVAALRLSGKTTRRDVGGLDIQRKAQGTRPDVSLTSAWRAVEFVPQRNVARSTGGGRSSAFASLNVPAGATIQCRRDDCKPLPAARGVYSLYDADGRLLYVGKAAHVRSRVRTHIRGRSDAGAFTGWTERIARVEARPAHSELEALLIEADLIRRLRPPFNSRMRSWERYRYLCRSDAPYAQLEVCRDRPADSLCFGPYSSRFAAEEILETVAAEFGTARCPATCAARGRPTLFPGPGPADLCERYFDDRCTGPCGQRISAGDYAESLKRRDALLGGRDDSTVFALEERIEAARDSCDERSLAAMQRRLATLKAAFLRGQMLREAGALLDALIVLPAPADEFLAARLSAAGLSIEPLHAMCDPTSVRPPPHPPRRTGGAIPKSVVDLLCTAAQELRRHPSQYTLIRTAAPHSSPADRRSLATAPAGILL